MFCSLQITGMCDFQPVMLFFTVEKKQDIFLTKRTDREKVQAVVLINVGNYSKECKR